MKQWKEGHQIRLTTEYISVSYKFKFFSISEMSLVVIRDTDVTSLYDIYIIGADLVDDCAVLSLLPCWVCSLHRIGRW